MIIGNKKSPSNHQILFRSTHISFVCYGLQRPFVYDITPSYGPMAGGTNVVLHGAWLNGTNQVMIGDKICNRSSQM